MHVERLKKVRQLIIDNEDRFNYAAFYKRTNQALDPIVQHNLDYDLSCGTCACVAGWTRLLELRETNNEELINSSDIRTARIAKAYLELDEPQTMCLFFCHSYRDMKYKPYERATVSDALERLDYLIAEGEASIIHSNS